MITQDEEWREEQERVHRVVDVVERRIAELEAFTGRVKDEVVEIRRDFWEDVTVNFEDAYEFAETYASIRQQAEVLSEKERSHQHAQEQLRTLHRLHSSPYFGRLDFTETGSAGTDVIYLGIGSLRDETGDTHLIYDWRAPVSSLYYDHQPGPVRYRAPFGDVTGTMERKRQYVIRDGRLISLFDAGETIGDEVLKEVLGQQSDGRMKSIVATIQADQNQIIRNERSKLIVVQGAAGSGKTSTALQRIAYLLYRYRENLRADHVILFSPNPVFQSYVATVLPELGEDNMRQTTFQQYLEHRLERQFALEDPFDQFEFVHTRQSDSGYHTRLAGIQFKSSPAFMDTIHRYLERLAVSGIVFRSVRFRGEIIVSAKEILRAYEATDRNWSIPNRIRSLTTWLLAQLDTFLQGQRDQEWVHDEIELLDTEDYTRAFQGLRKKGHFRQESFDDAAHEREALATLVLNRHAKPLKAGIRRLRFVNFKATYLQLFEEAWPSLDIPLNEWTRNQWAAICSQTAAAIREDRLLYEDMTPYLYLVERIKGFESNLSVRHVFLDEAQDYSPFQFAFIQRLFPRSRVTVLGDLHQAIYAHTTPGLDPKWLAELYGTDVTEHYVLTKSYRSTRQIVDFTRRMLPDGQSIEPFERDGNLPVMAVIASVDALHVHIAQTITALRDRGHEHIAVICKTAQESRIAHAGLSALLPIQLIDKDSVSYRAGSIVIPVSLAKGVEFDAVIVYNASADTYRSDLDRRLLYTACTRAMHDLHVYALGETTPLLTGVDRTLYEREG